MILFLLNYQISLKPKIGIYYSRCSYIRPIKQIVNWEKLKGLICVYSPKLVNSDTPKQQKQEFLVIIPKMTYIVTVEPHSNDKLMC